MKHFSVFVQVMWNLDGANESDDRPDRLVAEEVRKRREQSRTRVFEPPRGLGSFRVPSVGNSSRGRR